MKRRNAPTGEVSQAPDWVGIGMCIALRQWRMFQRLAEDKKKHL